MLIARLKPEPTTGRTPGRTRTRAADGSRLPEIGRTTFSGRPDCVRTVTAILRDRVVNERIGTHIVDGTPGAGWSAEVDVRSRNGFGGYELVAASCLFNRSGEQQRDDVGLSKQSTESDGFRSVRDVEAADARAGADLTLDAQKKPEKQSLSQNLRHFLNAIMIANLTTRLAALPIQETVQGPRSTRISP